MLHRGRRPVVTKIMLFQASDEFLEHCSDRGLEPTSVAAYTTTMNALMDVVGNIEVNRLSSKHVGAVFSARRWKAVTRNTRLSQMKTFFAWSRARGYMHRDSDPAFGWRNLKVPVVLRQQIPVSEWGYLFDNCIHPHERIVIATGLFLFLRASEQKRIQMKHIRLDDGEIDIHRVKGKAWDTMPITLELGQHLRSYLTYLSESVELQPDHYLIGRRGRPLKDDQNRWIAGTGTVNPELPLAVPHAVVKRVLDRAGYPTYFEGEHTLRRSGARAYFDTLVDMGYDGALRRVQSMLGHAQSGMTERYLGLDLDRRARNADLKGKAMFPALQDAKVVPIRREK
jgi:integrase